MINTNAMIMRTPPIENLLSLQLTGCTTCMAKVTSNAKYNPPIKDDQMVDLTQILKIKNIIRTNMM
jgi:hypothetical protein